ncbi:YbhB/YbcL family Raf kinase inhibitor-like protein [Tessaracoccus sp. SD287]|uniref:YbhB/YbcL family Raf kinase inhibitor-like protein n=1 Tax=Tessaracoccus sp. SD287 TaxID=2782008 RepID=UPI001A969D66|nr:YbhB/YbcL family Raf kinase inhibitor-like protein [Tessaracoccus sp. SD287]MBO1029948.1 YbhB/YbcL family Raf kinase inhibitor-like protein [Tessaracoccus sp. SD287]
MQLTSAGIPANGHIDLKFAEGGVGGRNVVPDLTWSDAPAETKSFAITVYDPDAPTGSGWWHWVAVDLPATITSIAEGAHLPESAREWVNDYGYIGYGGPYPPPGPAHHYVFTVYALPTERLDVPDEASSAATRMALLASAIDSASFTAMFANPHS